MSVPPTLYTSTARRVIEHVAARTGVPATVMLAPTRRHDAVRARWRAMRLLRRMHYSLPDIGYALNRDHTTVLHGLRRS